MTTIPPIAYQLVYIRAKLQGYVQELVNAQQSRVQQALRRIPDTQRHLLAVRGYVRRANRIDARWAMSDAEEREFQASAEGRAMQTEVAEIRRTFSASHRGYSLRAHVQARSLDTQLRMWNGNDTVFALGQRLWTLALREVSDAAAYPWPPTPDAVDGFRDWIRNVRLRAAVRRRRNGRTVTLTVNTPTNATPGLSSHGRIRAIDFVVMRGGRVVAGTDSAQVRSVWRGPDHWQRRLNAAITSVSSDWDGPLTNPDEPWHYSYTG